MKTIRFLRATTLFEIVFTLLLVLGFIIGITMNNEKLLFVSFIILAISHASSMILHWIAWKQLPTTRQHRIGFNLWVIGTFVTAFLLSRTPFIFLGAYMMIISPICWVITYMFILTKEYTFLSHKYLLYAQRELIHF